MTKELDALYNFVLFQLKTNSVYLSGNLKKGIKIAKISDNEVVIEIDAPEYDINKYLKEKIIVYTGSGRHYANETNTRGTIFRPKKTQYWVNTVCNKACGVIASQMGASVVCKVPINARYLK